MAMDNVKEVLQALFIGIAVASVLLQTCRYSKAIELFSECLVLLKENSSKLKEDTLSKLYALVYHRLFDLYYFVGDYENANHSCNEFFIHCEMDFFGFERAADFVTILNQLGESALSSFEYSKAEKYFQRELAISKETGDRKIEGRALRSLADLYRTTEEHQKAKQHYEEAMTILEEASEMKELGAVYNGLGRLYQTLRGFKKAKIMLKKALQISVEIGSKVDEMHDYRHLAGAHSSLGEDEEAEKCFQKALLISKELNNKKGEASTYSDLAVFYRDRNDFKKAEDYCKKAHRIYKEVGDLQNEGSENRELGDLYRYLGKYDEARKCHERALAIKKQIGDRRGEADSYSDLSEVYQSLGDFVKAKDCFEKVLSISKETNHLRGQGVDYGNLGAMYQHLGDYKKAYEYQKKALEIRLETGHIEGLPAAYNHLAVVYQHLGEYANAEQAYKQALAAAKEIGDRRNEATILSSSASLQGTIGELDKATALYKEALQISKEMGDIELEAEMNCNLGTAYHSRGDLTAAKKHIEESLAIIKQIGNKNKEGNVLGILGHLHFSLGECAQAMKCQQQALEISRETGNKKGEMVMNTSLGSLYLSQNEFQKALECFERALEICEQIEDLHYKSMNYCNKAVVYMVWQDIPKAKSYLSKSIKSLEKMRVTIGESDYYKIGFADQNAAPYQLMVTVLLQLGCVDKALSVSELARARSLAELMASQYSCQQLPCFDPNQWNDFANVIQTDFCTCLSFYFVGEYLLCWIVKAGGVEVATSKGLTAENRPQGASVQDWLESLANECVRTFFLLPEEHCEDRSLFLWDEHTEGRSSVKLEEGPPGSHDKEPKEKEEDKAPIIKEGPPECHRKEPKQEDEDKEPAALIDLYKLIITPVEKFLKGSELIIVPDRSLYRVPFAALRDESGEYLSEKFRIRFVPSLTTLKLIQDSPANYHSQTGVLIVGDPEVGLPECPPLPCAREEAEMIGQLLRVSPLTGKQATKEAVLQRIHSVSLIHIAAHGNADRGDIALAPAQDVKGKPKMEDFVLTMSDISKVQLRAKLVVLSCCHSARGQIKAEGVVGIARAFLGSGARSVLVSLWAVDDAATMQFMKQFYEHLVDGKSASESLHETMKWMRGSPEYHEVRKWAPFMLIGDDVSFDFSK